MTARTARMALGLLPLLEACTRAECFSDPAPQAQVVNNAGALTTGAASVIFDTSFQTASRRPTGLSTNECQLLPTLERVMFEIDGVIDCGALPRYATTGMRRAAQQCVLEAQRTARPFRVTYESPSYDSLESAGMAARSSGDTTFVQRTSTATAPWTMRARLRSAVCSELRVRDGCTFEEGDLCLDCNGAHLHRELCKKLETF